MIYMNNARTRLTDVLRATSQLQDELLELAEDDSVSAAVLVDYVERIERLDEERDKLVDALKTEATSAPRRPQDEKTTRQWVFTALDEIGWPVSARFLQDFIWAKHGVDIPSRSFAALRRDERRSWAKNPGKRSAYIVPAFNELANPRPFLTNSEWPIERRVITTRHGRPSELEALISVVSSVADETKRLPIDALIGRVAEKELGIPPADPLASGRELVGWRRSIISAAEREQISSAQRQVSTEKAARGIIEMLRKEDGGVALWGVGDEPEEGPDQTDRSPRSRKTAAGR
jgi:hypothetical protein